MAEAPGESAYHPSVYVPLTHVNRSVPPNLQRLVRQAVISEDLVAIKALMQFHSPSVDQSACTVLTSPKDIADWPIFLSITLGLRKAFCAIWEYDQSFFSSTITERCRFDDCKSCGVWTIKLQRQHYLPRWRYKRGQHQLNTAQIGMAFAVEAAHKDDFFL